MDWSRTKNIFIVTFLLLNLFLGYQLMEKRNDGKYNYISRGTLQENLEQMNIDIQIEGLNEVVLASPITGSTHFFIETDLAEKLEKQTIEVLSDTTIYSELEEPYQLGDVNMSVVVDGFLQQHVFRGEEYVYTAYDEERNIVGLHQTYEGKPVDNHEESGFPLVLNLNDEFEIVSYYQNYMDIDQQGREQEILSPIKAIERLFNDQLIPANTVIDHVELGYYSHLPPSGNYQVFTPMWQIRINDTNHYVNAIDGAIQQIN